MIGKENPISVRSKRLITESLLSLMETQPFSKIAIRDIVEKADLTRQTFYHNFESKEDVILHRLDELFDEYFKYLVDNKVNAIEDVIWLYFRFWQKNDRFVKLLIKNNLVYLLESKYPEYFRIASIVFLRGVEISDVECEYAYAFICGAVINLLISWVNSGELLTPKEMSIFTMKIVQGELYGIGIPKSTAKSQMARLDLD